MKYDDALNFLDFKFNNDFIDTLRISRRALPDLKHHRLKDLNQYFELDFGRLHRAMADCHVTKSVFDRCKNILGDDWSSTSPLNKSRINIDDLKSTVSEFDTDHIFYDSYIVMTGKLESFTRKEAFQIIVNLGGHPQNGITKDTNFLIVGDTDYSKNVKNGLTGKQKKAAEKQLAGQDIQILSESTFIEQL